MRLDFKTVVQAGRAFLDQRPDHAGIGLAYTEDGGWKLVLAGKPDRGEGLTQVVMSRNPVVPLCPITEFGMIAVANYVRNAWLGKQKTEVKR